MLGSVWWLFGLCVATCIVEGDLRGVQTCIERNATNVVFRGDFREAGPISVVGATNLTLNFGDARIFQSGEKSRYEVVSMWPSWGPGSGKVWNGSSRYQPFVSLEHCRDVRIIGGRFYGAEQQDFKPNGDVGSDPPVMLEVWRSQSVSVEGVEWTESPFWVAHIYMSVDVSVVECKLETWQLGVAVDSSSEVSISACRFRNGDDNVSLKSGVGWYGWTHGAPTRHVTVSECVFEGGFGVVLGSETACGISDVVVMDNRFYAVGAPVYLKTKTGCGGTLERLSFVNNTVDGVAEGVRVTMIQENHESANTTNTPLILDVIIQNMSGVAAKAGIFECYPNCRNINLSDIYLDSILGWTITNVTNLQTNNVYPTV